MKFTVTFITILSVSSAVLTKRVDEQKDKREAGPSYPSTSGHYPSLSSAVSAANYQQQAPSAYQQSSYQPQKSLSHGDASSINVGAGYSIGGAKPSYSFGGEALGQEGLQSGGHGQTYQLAPITLQPHQGLVGNDLSQIMSQLQHSLNSGALSLQPSSTVAEFHEGGQAGQPQGQFTYASPNIQQYVLAGSTQSAPSYSAGTKGLSSYGSTGPVLFNPSSEAQGGQAVLTFAAPSAGQSHGDASSLSSLSLGQSYPGFSLGSQGSSEGLSYGGAGLSLGGLGHSIGGASQSLAGFTLGSAGQSLGGGFSLGGSGGHSIGSGHSLGGSGYSLGGSGHSQSSSGLSLGSGHGSGHSLGGGSPVGGYYKVSSGKYGHGAPGKSSFKPSVFLGASVHGDSGLSGSHGAPSFPSFSSLSGSQGHSFGGYGSLGGPSKGISQLYTKSEGHGSDSTSAYSNVGQLASPPATTYGFPSDSYPAGAAHAAPSAGPQYYSSKYPLGFGEGFSYKGAGSSPVSSHSSGPKYSLGGHGLSSRYSSPKDTHGAFSETSYNTIMYSEELKPRA